MAKAGASLQVLDADEVADLISTEIHCDGLIDHRGGNLHPLNYALGLGAALIRAGAAIHGHSRAIQQENAGIGYKIETSGGVLRADKVPVPQSCRSAKHPRTCAFCCFVTEWTRKVGSSWVGAVHMMTV
jgi:glycine/D-amino acid oxidase-like deaminating enzyme